MMLKSTLSLVCLTAILATALCALLIALDGQEAAAVSGTHVDTKHAVPLLENGAKRPGASTRATFRTIDFPRAELTQCTSLNDRGDIVGYYGAPGKGDEGFLLKDGKFTILDASRTGRDTYPQSINDRGDIVGGFLVPATLEKRGFLLRRGKYRFLGGHAGVWENGINNRGDVAGSFSGLGRSPVTAQKPAAWGYLTTAAGKTSVIHVPGEGLGGCVVWGLNDHGDIAGDYVPSTDDDDADSHRFPTWMSYAIVGFARIGGRYVTIPGSRGALESECVGINNAGVVIGRYMDHAHLGHAFIWERGRYTELHAPRSYETVPQAINNHGQIAGYYRSIIDGRRHGFIYTP